MLDRIHSRAKITLALHNACKANKTLIDLVDAHLKRWDTIYRRKSAWYDSHADLLAALSCKIAQSIVHYDVDTAVIAAELMTTINDLIAELMAYGDNEMKKFADSINKRYNAISIDDNTEA